MPHEERATPQLRRVVAPVAAAGGHAQQAGDVIGALEQARQLRAQTVADKQQRDIRRQRVQVLNGGFVISAPVVERGTHMPQALALQQFQRIAVTTIVEGEHTHALPGQPPGKLGIAPLPHAHGGADNDLHRWRAVRFKQTRSGLAAAGRLQAREVGVLRAHDFSLIALRADGASANG